MRRKLIKQDAFDSLTAKSVATAERELSEVESILAKALDRDHLKLVSFDQSTVLYETLDHTYISAGYELKNGKIILNNIEELVIDDSSRRDKRRALIGEMLDNVMVGKDDKAQAVFQEYLSGVRFSEVLESFAPKKGKKGFFGKKDKKEDGDHEEKKSFFFGKAKKAGKEFAEAYHTGHNVIDYVKFMRIGPTLAESVAKKDDRGNITDLCIPTINERNESRLHRAEWRTLNTKLAEARKLIPELAQSVDFGKAMADLKRQNAFSDSKALEESMKSIISSYPDLLFVTEAELAHIIGESLTNIGVKNFDDNVCHQMAQGVLRSEHLAYVDKVRQVLHLASAPKLEEGTDPYVFFQNVVADFYPAIDEKFGLERKAFSDLYESLVTIYRKAERQGDNVLKNESASFINEIAATLNGELRPELEVAEQAAEFVVNVIETNLGGGTWNVSNTPHLTVNGDHPEMAKNAKKGYSPASDFSPNWGDEAPAIGQDSMDYKSGKQAKKMRNDSWGQVGPKGDTFPGLKNPYIPKPFGDYTMKGEKGVDKENTNFSMSKSSDLWPGLQNPYTPKEVGGTGGKGYKMKNGKETDLVVDR